MSESVANSFIDSLHKLEQNRDLESIVGLFASDCEVGNIVVPEKFHGPDGARQFWTKYRDTFDEMKSTFRNEVVTDERAVLEWSTEGTTKGKTPIHYDGVSILELGDGKIKRFRAYFDSAALGRQIEAASV
jgi:limonene-1,2-epoxide hydrolase